MDKKKMDFFIRSKHWRETAKKKKEQKRCNKDKDSTVMNRVLPLKHIREQRTGNRSTNNSRKKF